MEIESMASAPPRLRLIHSSRQTAPDEMEGRHGHRPPGISAGKLMLVVSIDNYHQLARVYGDAAARIVRGELVERSRSLCGPKGMANASGSRLLLVFDGAQVDATSDDDGPRDLLLLERVCLALGGSAVISLGLPVFAVISAEIVRKPNGAFNIERYGRGNRLEFFRGEDRRWCDEYRADMARASRIISMMEEGCIALDYEPVHDVSGGDVIYLEALPRIVQDADFDDALAVGMIALERLGLIRLWTQWLVKQIVGKLGAEPQTGIGCNIPSQSAVIDGWWGSIFATLRKQPDLASRLFIEITETPWLSDLDIAASFIGELKACRCAIVLAGVGETHSTLHAMVRSSPDVIKIAGTSSSTAGTPSAREFLDHLITFARACSTIVVVEGMETRATPADQKCRVD